MSVSRTWTICAVREAAGASMPSLIMKMSSEDEVVEVYSLAHPATGDRFCLADTAEVVPRLWTTCRAYHARRHAKRHAASQKRHAVSEKRHVVDEKRHAKDCHWACFS